MIIARLLGFIALIVSIFLGYIHFAVGGDFMYLLFSGLSSLTAGYLFAVKG